MLHPPGAEPGRGAAAGRLRRAGPTLPKGHHPSHRRRGLFRPHTSDGGPITEAQWRAFLADTVTPAFPDGLTAMDAYGQWRGGDGRIVQQPASVLLVALPGSDAAAARARLRPVEDAWKARFNQQSVLTVYRSACVGF